MICIVNTDFMIKVKLRDAMEVYRRRTGKRLTYEILSERTSISVDTLQSLAARAGYNTRLSTIEKLCRTLGCEPGDLLELSSGDEGAGDEN
jgi:DNA-binding Xre family transcriptional regulator